ncbi:2'-5' RNA ligase family protein [Ancylothrix sp. C2]|uniref:2'-5' RNA ligase family protein n=1 Tax=Ancylothrix sp. D3o TaxID=2953691 RepID=UPI0021BAA3CB|nr:2'-5' RNA ligase family protein [Ancylothrix sp. D3o]MCT7950792.1 2'-5' RNA ligase family protein [Ancylothrix sp. D3o]
MDKSKKLFFIALVPPPDIFAYVNHIKQDFAANYNSRRALNSPPHITLQPPFEWIPENVPVLHQTLREFAEMREPVNILLSGFGAFPPRVIYVNVIKTPALLSLQSDLTTHLETHLNIIDIKSKNRSFSPHLTVAFKDLTKQNFQAAWPEYKDKKLQFTFTASHLTLLQHDGSRWNIESEFPLLR